MQYPAPETPGKRFFAMPIFTVGHSTRSFDDFLLILRAWSVQNLVDIRSFPGSRRYPQFNRENLEQALPAAMVGYSHIKELGGRRRSELPESPNVGWKNESFRNYADYMLTAEFSEGLDRLVQLSTDLRLAIMCAEAVPWRCHRQLVSDALVALHGIEVQHILSAEKVQKHSLTSFAVPHSGRLIYPEVDPMKDSGQEPASDD